MLEEKIRIEKAYDSVNWDFLFGFLLAIGTPMGLKGLRQGDPSSLFFFITEMDVLSPMLNRTPRVSTFYGVFAGLKFGDLSGLVANHGKSGSETASLLADCLGFGVCAWSFPCSIPWASITLCLFALCCIVFRILKSYLWKGKEKSKEGVKVTLREVCLPFGEGGFAIRDRLIFLRGSQGLLIVGWVSPSVFELQRDRLKEHFHLEVGDGRFCRERLDSVLSPVISCSCRVLLGVILGIVSFWSWLPRIGLGGGMLSCLECVVRELGQARDPIILFQILRTCVRARAVSWREDVHDII
ncbi:Transposon TX1 uncharacterized [Cucumis melo var. makuwa]|uniref:Transposon TX1 uncharacterized n=1 Tax=Cucumis melo var. makuwa TaxID=1194695 RepID=A0A5D3BGL1_CUCMM|nr:Transposon TX1 uncharacterized [Cucumis melo var. makuwa]